jgi:hypothetical protein
MGAVAWLRSGVNSRVGSVGLSDRWARTLSWLKFGGALRGKNRRAERASLIMSAWTKLVVKVHTSGQSIIKSIMIVRCPLVWTNELRLGF